MGIIRYLQIYRALCKHYSNVLYFVKKSLHLHDEIAETLLLAINRH